MTNEYRRIDMNWNKQNKRKRKDNDVKLSKIYKEKMK